MKKNEIMLNTSNEKFAEIVASNKSFCGVSKVLGLRAQGSNYRTIKNRIIKQGLSTSHFSLKRPNAAKKRSLKEILIENIHYNSRDLKKRLVKEGIFKDKCFLCPVENVWNEKPITLQLDHINGNHLDNRIENLRILCPNCHSQTMTHSGRNKKMR